MVILKVCGVLVENLEGFRPEWCISTIHHASDTPFWPRTLEIVGAVNMMYTNTTARDLSPDGDTEFFEIVAGVLQGKYPGTIFIHYFLGLPHEASSLERKQPRIHSR